MEEAQLTQIKDEHKEWMQELSYWHNELVYFTNVMMRQAGIIKDERELEKYEEFKSRFDTMQEKLTDMKTRIQAHDQSIQNSSGEAVDGFLDNHDEIRWEIRDFYKEFRKIKDDYYAFADKEC
jgi:hypothetical protein